MKILVVDDTLSERMYVMARLDRLGYEVVGAADGVEALERFARLRPDLVLLDVVMPVMDGFETARRLRAIGNEWVPIIFLSQRATDADIAAGIDAGGDDYLVKPASDTVLMAKMRAMQRIAAMRAHQAELTASVTRLSDKLSRIAEIDGLTGLPNRRRLDADLVREWETCARFRQPLAAMMIGIDRLREIDERHGYLTGDDCLKRVAEFLENEIETPPDLLSRYGGRKFFVLLPDRSIEQVTEFAEHLCRHAHDLTVPDAADSGKTVALALSIGVAGFFPETAGSPSRLLEQTREMLTRARRAGGDRVVAAFEDGHSPAPSSSG